MSVKRASFEIPAETKARAVALRREGKTYTEIENALDEIGMPASRAALCEHFKTVPGLAKESKVASAADLDLSDDYGEGAREALSAWRLYTREVKKLVKAAGAIDPKDANDNDQKVAMLAAKSEAMAIATKGMAMVVKGGDAAMKWRQLLRGRPTSHSKSESVPTDAPAPPLSADQQAILDLATASAPDQ